MAIYKFYAAIVGTVLVSAFTGRAGEPEHVDNKQVETNAVYHEVVDTLLPGSLNVVTWAAPRAVKLSEIGLKEAGLRGGAVFRAADEIRIFASRDQTESSPKARIWFNTRENAWWFHTGGAGSAQDLTLQVGEVMVIVTKASTAAMAWSNPLR